MEGLVINLAAESGLSTDALAQETGTSPIKIISQKAATDIVMGLENGTLKMCQVPLAVSMYKYTGEELAPTWIGYRPDDMTISGTTSATDAGAYAVIFAPAEGVLWPDGTHEPKEAEWFIAKAPGTCVPSQSSIAVNMDAPVSFTVSRMGEAEITAMPTSGHVRCEVEGDRITVYGLQSGTTEIIVYAAETDNYTFAGASVSVIVRDPVEVPYQTGSLTYNGTSQKPQWAGYQDGNTKLTISGETEAVNAGVHTVTFTLAEGCCWLDGTMAPKKVTWTIGRAPGVCTPSQSSATITNTGSTSFTVTRYEGAQITAATSNNSVATVSVSGNTVTVTGKGRGSATITLQAAQTTNYNAASSTFVITVNQILSVPAQSGTTTWNGASQTPSWNNYSTASLTIGGTSSATNAGTYTVTFTPKSGYCWSDGTTSAKSVSWTMNRASISVPSQSGTLTYTGSIQSPKWSSTSYMTTSGTTSATNAGTYAASFTPDSNHKWTDGTTGVKSVNWTIAKAAGSLSLDKASMSLGLASVTDTVTITRAGNGTISASSSDSSVVTATLSGTTVTLTAIKTGTATITVSVAAGTNHTVPSNKTCSITCIVPSSDPTKCTAAEVQAATRAGVASKYWNVGDAFPVKINGTVDGQTLNLTLGAQILGFDHNADLEGHNTIQFVFGRIYRDFVLNTFPIAIHGFKMNSTDNNSGGFAVSYMNNTVLPQFLNCIENAWRAIITPCPKWTSSGTTTTYGATSYGTYGYLRNTTAAEVTCTSYNLWLMATYEIYGSYGANTNPNERDKQQQFDLYKNGETKVRYKHTATNATYSEYCSWWFRTPSAYNLKGFQYSKCYYQVHAGGSTDHFYGQETSDMANVAHGIAPCFMVA